MEAYILKNIFLITCILFLFLPLPVFGADYIPEDVAADAVKNGGVALIWQIGDEIIKSGGGNESLSLVEMVDNLATYNPNPYRFEVVQEMVGRNRVIALFFAVMAIFAGCALASNQLAVADERNFMTSSAMSKYRYLTMLKMLVAMLFFPPLIVLLMININKWITGLCMLDSLNYIEPGIENFWLYFWMTICYFALALMFAIRFWVCYVIVPSMCWVLGVMYAFELTRGVSIWVFNKFAALLVMQPVIVFVTSLCLPFCSSPLLAISPGVGILAYLALIVVLFCIAWKFTFGSFGLFKWIGRLIV